MLLASHFKMAQFITFPFHILIDETSLKRTEYFEYKGKKYRLMCPYKTYPYNHDFSYKPRFYFDKNGAKVNIPEFLGGNTYPMINQDYKLIGSYVQLDYKFDLKNAIKLTVGEIPIVEENLLTYGVVDTLRFDSSDLTQDDDPKLIDTFIKHLRIFSRQFWIGKPPFGKTCASVSGKIKLDSNIHDIQFHSNSLPIFKVITGRLITQEIWRSAIDRTIKEEEVDLSISLFLDAVYEYLVEPENQRIVILNLANSIDIKLNMLLFEINSKKGGGDFDRQSFVEKYKQRKKIWSTYIPDLISEFLEGVIDRNYQLESPDNFDIIKDFWQNKRNIVAHGGRVHLEEFEYISLFEAIEDLLYWLEIVIE